MSPVFSSTCANKIGAIREPTPKKKCNPFMKGPDFSPCVQSRRVLQPTSRMPAARPLRNIANKSIVNVVEIGIQTEAAAIKSTVSAINL